MKIVSAAFILLMAVSPPIFAQLDGGLNNPRDTLPMCINASFRAQNPQLCDRRSPAQRMADENRKLIKEFKNSATQFKVDCPQQMKIHMTPDTPPTGFTAIGSAMEANLSRVEVNGSKLSCQYVLPALKLGTDMTIYSRYEYSAAGKQCSFSAYPCEVGRCSMVCDK